MIIHGWLHIQLAEAELSEGSNGIQGEEDAIRVIRQRIELVGDQFSVLDVKQGGNGLIAMTVNGVRNHRSEGVIDLFRWAAEQYPESFGLLHVWDDEHAKYDNCFRVYRYAHGQCDEMEDPHLSPCIPTIERPYEPVQ